jgi:hypothetical protein
MNQNPEVFKKEDFSIEELINKLEERQVICRETGGKFFLEDTIKENNNLVRKYLPILNIDKENSNFAKIVSFFVLLKNDPVFLEKMFPVFKACPRLISVYKNVETEGVRDEDEELKQKDYHRIFLNGNAEDILKKIRKNKEIFQNLKKNIGKEGMTSFIHNGDVVVDLTWINKEGMQEDDYPDEISIFLGAANSNNFDFEGGRIVICADGLISSMEEAGEYRNLGYLTKYNPIFDEKIFLSALSTLHEDEEATKEELESDETFLDFITK